MTDKTNSSELKVLIADDRRVITEIRKRRERQKASARKASAALQRVEKTLRSATG